VLDHFDTRGFCLTDGFDHQEALTVKRHIVSGGADSR